MPGRAAEGASLPPDQGRGSCLALLGKTPRARSPPARGTLLSWEFRQGTSGARHHGLKPAGKPHGVVLLPSETGLLRTDRQTQTHVPSEPSSSSSSGRGTCSTRSNATPGIADTSCPHSVGRGGAQDPQEMLGNCFALSFLLPPARGSGEHLHSWGSRDERLPPGRLSVGQARWDIAQEAARGDRSPSAPGPGPREAGQCHTPRCRSQRRPRACGTRALLSCCASPFPQVVLPRHSSLLALQQPRLEPRLSPCHISFLLWDQPRFPLAAAPGWAPLSRRS